MCIRDRQYSALINLFLLSDFTAHFHKFSHHQTITPFSNVYYDIVLFADYNPSWLQVYLDPVCLMPPEQYHQKQTTRFSTWIVSPLLDSLLILMRASCIFIQSHHILEIYRNTRKCTLYTLHSINLKPMFIFDFCKLKFGLCLNMLLCSVLWFTHEQDHVGLYA